MIAECVSPVCIRIDLSSFDGPPHYVQRFRNGTGWLIIARAREAGGSRETYLWSACDECGHGHPGFQVAHLLDCGWSLAEPCDGYVPDELEDLLEEEQGALALQWLREDYRELRQADEADEIALARQESETRLQTDRIDRQIADLRRRRRDPDLSEHNRQTIDAALIELSAMRDRATAAFARSRRTLRADTADIEERLLLQSDLRVELEIVFTAHWRVCVTRKIIMPPIEWRGGSYQSATADWRHSELDDPDAQERRRALKRPQTKDQAVATTAPSPPPPPPACPATAVEVTLGLRRATETQLVRKVAKFRAGTNRRQAEAALEACRADIARLEELGVEPRPVPAAPLVETPPLLTCERVAVLLPTPSAWQQIARKAALTRLDNQLKHREQSLKRLEGLTVRSTGHGEWLEESKSVLRDEIEALAAKRAEMVAGQE